MKDLFSTKLYFGNYLKDECLKLQFFSTNLLCDHELVKNEDIIN